MLHEQIALCMQAQRDQGIDLGGLVASFQAKLSELYSENLPLAQLKDTSDLIIHAEGPSAKHHAAASNVVAWLCEETERRLKQLGTAALRVAGNAAQDATGDIKVLLNGLAPGSLYLGFSVDSEARIAAQDAGVQTLLETQGHEPAIARVRNAIMNLQVVPRFVDDESVSAGIAEAIDDPQLRDATLIAAYHLAPTGKRGIHTIELSSPKGSEPMAALTNRERVVLRESAVKRPMMRHATAGTFVGELREIDLDAYRFQLRDVPGIGTLRCSLAGLTAEVARKHIGRGVRVTGSYEADFEGRPRLMAVAAIEPFQRQGKLLEQ
jgi:hypothetical protein